jgi:hypothetical protein
MPILRAGTLQQYSWGNDRSLTGLHGVGEHLGLNAIEDGLAGDRVQVTVLGRRAASLRSSAVEPCGRDLSYQRQLFDGPVGATLQQLSPPEGGDVAKGDAPASIRTFLRIQLGPARALGRDYRCG